MTMTEIKAKALQLPERERLELASELWASVGDSSAAPDPDALPRWKKDLIVRRLEASKDDPGIPWEEVRAELWPENP